jgi:hypothetical protein
VKAPLLNRVCPRCNQVTTPRHERPPRYCANCGTALPPTPPWRREAPARRAGSRRISKLALAAFLCALLGFIPMCGAIGAVTALGLAAQARSCIEQPGSNLAGSNLAKIATALGIIALIIQFLLCIGFR